MNTSLPLKALVCFDAAMRHNSFSLAADELNVTPGTVGQQVRNLEQWLGVSLFVRHIRRIQPCCIRMTPGFTALRRMRDR